MGMYIDCDYCGEEMTPGSKEYVRFDAADPSTSRDLHLGAARLHHECIGAVRQLLSDHKAWITSRSDQPRPGERAGMRWELTGHVAEPVRPTPPGEDATSVRELGFTPRTRNALLRRGIKTVAQLAATPDDELLAGPNFGPHALREVHEALEERLSKREGAS